MSLSCQRHPRLDHRERNISDSFLISLSPSCFSLALQRHREREREREREKKRLYKKRENVQTVILARTLALLLANKIASCQCVSHRVTHFLVLFLFCPSNYQHHYRYLVRRKTRNFSSRFFFVFFSLFTVSTDSNVSCRQQKLPPMIFDLNSIASIV